MIQMNEMWCDVDDDDGVFAFYVTARIILILEQTCGALHLLYYG